MVKFITANAPALPLRKRAKTAAQIEAQKALKEARDATAERRLDTRRKVVVGAALMTLAEHDPTAARLLASIKRSLPRPADRKLFEDPPNG